MQKIKQKLFPQKSKWGPIDNDDPKTYDGTDPGWGQHISISKDSKGNVEQEQIEEGPDQGSYFDVYGHWKRRPRLGDKVVKNLIGEDGEITVVAMFVQIRLCNDPPDMFFGKVKIIAAEKDPLKLNVTIDYGPGQRFVKWGPEPGARR